MMEDRAPSSSGQSDGLAHAQRAILAGDRELGRRLLTRLLEQDRRNETVWLWLSTAVTSDRRRRACLHKVLSINPQNQVARQQLWLLERRAKARQSILRQRDRTQRAQSLVVGGLLALVLFFGGLAVLMTIGGKLASQPIALVPLYTRPAIVARLAAPSPVPTFTAAPQATLPSATPAAQTILPTVALAPTVAFSSTKTPAPGVEKVVVATETESATEEIAVGRGEGLAFAVPVSGRVSVGFSRVHPAFDFDAPIGTSVVAAADGRVIFAGQSTRGHGNLVVLRHAAGWQSWYGHLESFAVDAGDWACRTCPIGTVGDTGASSGPHLHFEIRQGCSFYNLFTGEHLASGVTANFRYDPFGAPICLAAATTPPLSERPPTELSAPGGRPVETEEGEGLSDPTSPSP